MPIQLKIKIYHIISPRLRQCRNYGSIAEIQIKF